MANRLILPEQRAGRLLDFGCGSSPFFLSETTFGEKFGVDKMVPESGSEVDGIKLSHFDVDTQDRLPFESESFDVVTMLAVFEHIDVERLVLLIDEIHRVLKKGGVYILTTPSGWTGPILDLLKVLRMVSSEEIDEHKDSYTHKKIRSILDRTRFAGSQARFGYFELYMNIWGLLHKDG